MINQWATAAFIKYMKKRRVYNHINLGPTGMKVLADKPSSSVLLQRLLMFIILFGGAGSYLAVDKASAAVDCWHDELNPPACQQPMFDACDLCENTRVSSAQYRRMVGSLSGKSFFRTISDGRALLTRRESGREIMLIIHAIPESTQ